MEKNLLILSFLSVVLSTQADSIYVQFDKNEGDLLELPEWNANDATSDFKRITAETATIYCSGNKLDECSLTVESTFIESDVVISEPEAFNGDIRFLVYIRMTGKNVTSSATAMLPKAALIEVLTQSRDTYKLGLADEDVGYNIILMFVDEVRMAPPIDYTTNYIMVGVSISILLSACILALVLKCKESMDDKSKLARYEDNTGSSQRPNDGTEQVNLTTIKSPDDDSKEASEAQPMI